MHAVLLSPPSVLLVVVSAEMTLRAEAGRTCSCDSGDAPVAAAEMCLRGACSAAARSRALAADMWESSVLDRLGKVMWSGRASRVLEACWMSSTMCVITARLVRGLEWHSRWDSWDEERLARARSVLLRTQCQDAIRPAILAALRTTPASAAFLAKVSARRVWAGKRLCAPRSQHPGGARLILGPCRDLSKPHGMKKIVLGVEKRSRGKVFVASCCTTTTEDLPATAAPFPFADTFPAELPCTRNELSHLTVRCVALIQMSLLSFISIKMP